MKKEKIAVFTGAGISAESGISTFRDSKGLWEGHDWMEVASPEGWMKNPELVLEFYNQRRKNVMDAEPNAAHQALVRLEEKYHVDVITQNVDDLHERAGSSNILHLHGEIRKARSTKYPELIYDVSGSEIKMGDLCEKGAQLRPHIVWFGEEVPEMQRAIPIVESADFLLIIGTSLVVYPAAALAQGTKPGCFVYAVDPQRPAYLPSHIQFLQKTATAGVPELVDELLNQA